MWCNWCALPFRLIEKGGNAGITVATYYSSNKFQSREINSSVPNEWRRWKRGYKMLTVFYSIPIVQCTYITTLCIACPLAHIFHCLNFSYTFFCHSACKRNFHWMHYAVCCKNGYSVLSSHLFSACSFDHSFILFFFLLILSCREIDTDSSGEKIIYGCIWFTCSINSSVQLHFHTHCVQLMHFQFFSASVPFGECFRSSHFFSLVGSDFFDNYFRLNVIEIGAQLKNSIH